MASLVRAPGHRRVASFLLAVVAVTAVAAPAAVTATTETVDAAAITAAESAMVSLLNADRTALGLVPVRVDSRLMAVARARSVDMVTKHYFSHTQPDGRNVFDILTAKRITWYTAGEIIAWNNYPMDSTASAANRQWLGSPGHYAIITSSNYNYVGVGLAVDPDTGKKVWTAVFLKGPDRTAARAATGTPKLTWLSSTKRSATVSWTGFDPRLQVLTAGLRSFAVQVRTDGGSWRIVTSGTTSHTWTFTAWKGHRYEVRVSALDRAGNRGPWVTSVVDLR